MTTVFSIRTFHQMDAGWKPTTTVTFFSRTMPIRRIGDRIARDIGFGLTTAGTGNLTKITDGHVITTDGGFGYSVPVGCGFPDASGRLPGSVGDKAMTIAAGRR